MNRFVSSSFRGALAGALAVALSASTAYAATSGSVTLQGTVASTLEVTATATAGASALNLSTSSEQIVKVADVSMSTNNEQGLTLTLSSGSLTKTGGTSIAYQVTTVADAGLAPASADFTVASGTNYTHATSASGSDARDLYIKYTPAALQDPGTYEGTITVTVADNA